MNRKIFFLLLIALLTGVCGCKSTKSLDRTPPKSKQKSVRANRSCDPLTTGDPLFDSVFRKSRRESDSGGFASADLTEKERDLYNQNRAIRASDDPMVRAVHEKNRDAKKERSNWVYGVDKNLW